MFLESKLKESRFKHQKKLNETNLYLYKSITSYIKNSQLRGFEKEESLQQVMDMMLQAQLEGKPMNLIVGHDYEEFCNSIIEEYSSDKSNIYKGLDYIQKAYYG
jgi:DNA-binding ferritin-like protein (Dps family)